MKALGVCLTLLSALFVMVACAAGIVAGWSHTFEWERDLGGLVAAIVVVCIVGCWFSAIGANEAFNRTTR